MRRNFFVFCDFSRFCFLKALHSYVSRAGKFDNFWCNFRKRKNVIGTSVVQSALRHFGDAGILRILNDADVVTVLLQNVVDAFPTSAVNKTAVYEDDGYR